MEQERRISKASELNEIVRVLLSILDLRSQDIIRRRYGLESGQIETLDSIGQEYGITRERVRQIEAQAKKMLARREDALRNIASMLEEVFAQHGGILTDDFLMLVLRKRFTDAPGATMVMFFLDILPDYERVTRSEKFRPHWSHPQLHHEYVEQVVTTADSILRKTKNPIMEKEMLLKIREQVAVAEEILPDACVKALLEASKELKRTVFGEWGLRDWVETSPRGVGDKAYIVLRRNGEPMHFRDIAAQINEVKFDHKKAHEQTVHNELIKDNRFVLVGRGMYGLSDWGFLPGTVADVLEAILSKAGKPMKKDELLAEVMKQRMVKRTTIILGLQNNDKFARVEDDQYTLKNANLSDIK
ncbi:MAG: hypothetical protein A3E37_05530 [Candidatus Andersenbacteria bacterium RIFCSPHIGHO2_12_FULL_46_9]|nr:MAG: RNA polymerase sigma factor [Parcubacteria group bacterium GW2011_GWA2_45_14]OGY33713.1 MAG: hypothetical protein A3B76_02525 [Candidatus Andersenbacteria bacterium RIFCSPHIGHO2_02_FULL_46_16]OGY36147.1 MAG: hypothetical protein A3I08_04835 [Candidatus Andersenbacteria bacterium RIFCSPLOWO2_02_FULL_46_11]OGY38030.1 MAG: hypothetical protein A3E37_05530 [Candidatus Andersenbacteria bacterium RIFCSPHIGHO2_12_FULL_46_9]OGY42608.1 MAG: hypothetical protein A3G57_05035 [Candidatus Andersenba